MIISCLFKTSIYTLYLFLISEVFKALILLLDVSFGFFSWHLISSFILWFVNFKPTLIRIITFRPEIKLHAFREHLCLLPSGTYRHYPTQIILNPQFGILQLILMIRFLDLNPMRVTHGYEVLRRNLPFLESQGWVRQLYLLGLLWGGTSFFLVCLSTKDVIFGEH